MCSSDLRASLRHAYDHQAPYRARCEAAGVHPDDLETLDDLRRFPFTTKGDLRDAYPFGMFAIPREKCVRVHASSGTTGRPTVVGYSANDIAGIVNDAGNVLGLMPHPEHAVDPLLGPTGGAPVLSALVTAARERLLASV